VVTDTINNSAYLIRSLEDLQRWSLLCPMPVIDLIQIERNTSIGSEPNVVADMAKAREARSDQQICDVLVIEENTAIRTVLREVLHNEGYRVHTVADGHEALDYLAQTTTVPGVILLDLMMPIMTGWEFRALQRADNRYRNVPIIVMSSVAHDVSQQQLAGLEAVALIPKPINWGRLLAAVSAVVSSSCSCTTRLSSAMF
jgi:CheY-like chemotaxis protein